MKKKLEADLISIAHRILKLKGKEDVDKMHAEVAQLYEKLSVLKFAHENFEDDLPTIGRDSSFFGMLDSAFNNQVSDNIEVGDKLYINLDEKEDDGIMEPAIEKIKNMVAFMPEAEEEPKDILDELLSKKDYNKNDLDNLTEGFKDMPVFDPVPTIKNGAGEKKSLNDKLKGGGLSIGLNDKIAFIKHLFDGKNEDYERVISQLNTFKTLQEATQFITEIVKPDYNNWQNKEEFEERLFQIVTDKFQ
ncbi:hypothetical protein [Gaetbulibacter saemankumensis]|uniref:hypothetical protein n=1 Tax=Gaetbulibacter saemankumensis TaxID=311208 RepID=UPI0003FA1E63|nr:hypothetical protein [Gaetbulibacter saemankumensis]